MKVEIGPKRIDAVLDNAREQLHKRYRLMVQKLDPLNDNGLNDANVVEAIFQDMANYAWRGYEDVRARIPGEWCENETSILVIVDGVRVGWTYRDKALAPLYYPANYGSSFDVQLTDFTGIAHEALSNWLEAYLDHEAESKKVLGTLDKLLRTHKTLNELLAAYPAVEEYVPPEDVERVRAVEPPKRNPAKQDGVIGDVDVSAFDPSALALLTAVNKL